MGSCYSTVDNKSEVDAWNQSFVEQNKPNRISWLGEASDSCRTMPEDVKAKLAAKMAAPTIPPPSCACDNSVMGRCNSYGSNATNQSTVDNWNKNFVLQNKPERISWLGEASDSCRTMPEDVKVKLAAKKAAVPTVNPFFATASPTVPV